MANSTVFPIYIRSEYKESTALKRFESDAQRAAQSAKRELAGVGAALEQALSRPRNAGGSLDLGVDELRRAAAAQAQVAAGAREIAEATRRAATANGQFDQSLSRSARAAFEYANAQERSSQQLQQQVATLDRVQAELSQVASATNAVTVASQRGAMVAGQQRQGLQQLSFQLNDVATQFALGAKPAQIFAAQSGQIIQAVQMMTGGTSRLAAFLGGPWGLALTSAAIVVSPFIGKLFESEDAGKKMREALDGARFASDGMSSAQSILGSVIDLTTGRMREQTGAAITLARAQLQLAEVKARVAANEARATLVGATKRTRLVGIEGNSDPMGGPGSFTQVRKPTVSAAAAQRALSGDTQGALDELKRAVDSGRTTTEIYAEAATAVANLGAETENMKKFAAALKALDGDQKALGQFLKPQSAKKPRQDRSAERLAEFGEGAAERIKRLNEAFDDQPRLIDRAAQAVRELDDLIADLGKRRPKGFADLISDAEEAKQTVEAALLRPFEQLRKESAQRLQIEELLAQGRQDEASALQETLRLEQAIGSVTSDQRREIEEIVRAEAQRTRYLRDQQRLFEAQLDVVGQVQRSLTDLLSGRSSDFFGNFRQALQDLQGQRLFEDLFGDTFRQIEEELRGNSPQGRANAAYAAEVERTATATQIVGDAAISLAQAFDEAMGIVRGTPAGAANDNGNEITVTARRPQEVRIARLSVMEIANRLGASIGTSIGAQLEDVLGPQFAGLLGDVLGGVIAGKATGGNVGAVLGGTTKLFESGILGNDNRISETFGKATEGAAIGTQLNGLVRALKLPNSKTGAQVGGAIGSAIPIPGAAQAGSIIGSIIGGLLKGTPRGSANLTGAGQFSLSGNNKKGAQDTAAGLAGEVSNALRDIARQLGAELGAFAVSIGVSGDSFHVDPTGQGRLKKSQGGKDFNQDQAAAIAFAIGDAIADGAIKGLSAAEDRLLRANKDIEAALKDVLTFRSVADRLREIKDPVGFAIGNLNREFSSLIDLFNKASASTEELAGLEELYGIERAKAIEDATSRVVGSLKALLADLRVGDNGLSLRDRQSNALTKYNGLAARVAAGDVAAFDDFADVSRQLLDIERALFGSTQSYFDRLSQVTTLTEDAINRTTAGTTNGSTAPNPFDERAAVVKSIDSSNAEQVGWLKAINDNLIALNPAYRAGGGGGGGGFDGSGLGDNYGRLLNF